jgi:hypothetical protein
MDLKEEKEDLERKDKDWAKRLKEREEDLEREKRQGLAMVCKGR